MSNRISKFQYISEVEYNSLLASHRSQFIENQKLNAEVLRLNHVIKQLYEDVIVANEDAKKYRDMYLSLREGKYLLIPK